jgi:hypothetical protein
MVTPSATLLTVPMFGLKLAWTAGALFLLLTTRVRPLVAARRLCAYPGLSKYFLLCDRRTVDEVKRCSTRKPSANSSKG